VATELFVGMCVLSRVSSLIAERGEGACQDELRIARVLSSQARGKISASLRALIKNADGDAMALADSVISNGGYGWDVL